MTEFVSSSFSATGMFLPSDTTFRASPTADASNTFRSNNAIFTTALGPPVTVTSADVFSTVSASAPTPTSIASFTVTLPASTSASSTVNGTIHPTSESNNHTSGSSLSTPNVIAIAVSATLLLLVAVGLLFYLIRRSQRKSLKNSRGAPSDNVDPETMEKYGSPTEHGLSSLPYGGKASNRSTRISLPFLRTSFDEIRRSSQFSSEFHDSPPSPFVNGEVETTLRPLAHASSLADATPFSDQLTDAQFDAAPLPNPHSHTRMVSSQLPPITIPSTYTAPSRRPSKGKRVSRNGSKHGYRAIDTADGSDVDSASLYSQASAYTARYTFASSTEGLPASATYRGPPSAGTLNAQPPQIIYEKRDSSASTIRQADFSAGNIGTSETWQLQSTSSEHGTDTTGEMTRENTAFVAQLLKSRVRNDPQPARSDSIVSHIERKGSIKPAMLYSGGDSEARGIRSLRAMRKSRGHSPMSPS